MAGIEVIPSAKRLIKSLRDMGYDFAQAVADVVDNSIEAGATTVAIDVEFEADDSWIRIADNGTGMRPEELREALRYGAERQYREDDLGKFGLGLKTASMSQCQKLCVASRWNKERADISAYCWDLNHIERTNKWEILPVDRDGVAPAIRLPLKETTGTVVLWQRLDRILGYRHPYGEAARKRLFQMCRDVEEHLGMVFHRFLAGEVRGRKLKILVNGNTVRPWDPFCRDEPKTKQLSPIRLKLDYELDSGDIVTEAINIEPYVLPHQDNFSSQDAFRMASGPANWNQQQGLYIYRAGRMIQSGGWSGLRTADEHTKLARVAIHFLPALDEAFKINVAKMRVQLPGQLKDAIRDAVGPMIKLARETYGRKAAKRGGNVPGTPDDGGTTSGTKTLGSARTSATRGRAGELLTLDEWARRAMAVADPKERAAVQTVVAKLRLADAV